MRLLRIVLAVMFIVSLSAAPVAAEEKGSGYESNGCPMKGPAGMHAETEDITASGDIRFTDYCSMAGKKCVAFMETKDGTSLCIIDNAAASRLKEEIGGKGKVKIMGAMKKDAEGRYVTIDQYEIIEKTPGKKGSGYNDKNSVPKGSY